MGFYGYEEAVCEKGHTSEFDIHIDAVVEPECECGSKFAWFRLVDQTNGVDEDDPRTQPTEFKLYGYEIHREEDIFGNTYYTREPVYYIPNDDGDSPKEPNNKEALNIDQYWALVCTMCPD